MSSNNRPRPRLELPRDLQRRLAPVRALASRENARVFLVGGAVRDILLGHRAHDLDLVLDGGALPFARRLAARLGVAARVHDRFGTASLELPGGWRLDIATSRRETYQRPGALPRVEGAPIEEDLGRRDFTINAMAREIAPGRRFLDPFGGRGDLRRGFVRMLHPRSAFDDPTRAFRAVRYANRLGFRIEPRTRRWIRQAVREGVFAALSGDRLRREVRLILSEGRRSEAVRSMGRLGLSGVLHAALRCDPRALDRLCRAEEIERRNTGRTTWLLYLLVWSADLASEETAALAERLSLGRAARRILRSWPAVARQLFGSGPAGLAKGRFSPDEIAAAAAVAPQPARRARLERALSAPRVELTINGRDLLEAGVPPGPVIGEALAQTSLALGGGRIRPEEELDFALRVARKGPW